MNWTKNQMAVLERPLLLGDEKWPQSWPDYEAFGFDSRMTPDLLKRLRGSVSQQRCLENQVEVAHLCRILAILHEESAIPWVVACLEPLAVTDWAVEDWPRLIGIFGKAALPAVREEFLNSEADHVVRGVLSCGMVEIAEQHPENRYQIIQELMRFLKWPEMHDRGLLSVVVSGLGESLSAEEMAQLKPLFDLGFVEHEIAGCYADLVIYAHGRSRLEADSASIKSAVSSQTTWDSLCPCGSGLPFAVCQECNSVTM